VTAATFYKSGDIDAEFGMRVGNLSNPAKITKSGEPNVMTPGGFLLERQRDLPWNRADSYIETIHRQSLNYIGTSLSNGQKGGAIAIVT